MRIAAAEALGRFGSAADVDRALPVLLELADAEAHGAYMAMLALNAIDRLGGLASEARDAIRALPATDPTDASRHQYGVAALLEHVLAASD